MTVEAKYFTDEHFAHPEWWTIGASMYPVLWIGGPPNYGEVSILYKGPTGLELKSFYKSAPTLLYTPPDPWKETVPVLPRVELWSNSIGTVMLKAEHWRESEVVPLGYNAPAVMLPRKLFTLTPVEGSDEAR